MAVRACVDEQVVHDAAEERAVEWQREGLGVGGRVDRDGGGRGLLGRAGAQPRRRRGASPCGGRRGRRASRRAGRRGCRPRRRAASRRRRARAPGSDPGGASGRQSIAGDLERDARTPEGGPQLVTDGAEELALAAHHRLDAVGHAVEARRPPRAPRARPIDAPRPMSARNARSPPPKRSDACASCSRGRASRLATRPAMSESTRHDEHERERRAATTARRPGCGPELLHLERADAALRSRTTGMKMCCGFSGTMAAPSRRPRVHARRRACADRGPGARRSRSRRAPRRRRRASPRGRPRSPRGGRRRCAP